MMTPEQAKQRLADESTIVVLAGCMITTIQLLAARDGVGVAKVVSKVGQLLKRDPGFLKRFQTEQDAIMKEYNEMVAPEKPGSPFIT